MGAFKGIKNVHVPHINKRTRFVLLCVLALSVIFVTLASAAVYNPNNTYVQFSTSSQRTSSQELTDKTLSGLKYVFIKPTNVKKVYFYLDSSLSNEQLNASNYTSRDLSAPFDLSGSTFSGKAKALDTSKLANGLHTLRVVIVWQSGYESLKVVNFYVSNPVVTLPPTTTTTTTTTVPPTTTPPTTTTPPNPTARSGYTLMWNDEFDGTTLGSNWGYTTGGLTRDLGCYTRNNVTVGSGVLNIATKAETGTCDANHSNFTTGEVTSQNRVSPTQSPSGVVRIDMMAQMPRFTVGVWPGLWSRNEFSTTGSTASRPYGEADLIEQWGDESNSGIFYATSHSRYGSLAQQKNNWYSSGKPLDSGMHLYSTEIDITRNEIRYYFDNTLIATNVASQFDAAWSTSLRGSWNAKVTVQIAKTDQWHTTADPVGFSTTNLKVDYIRAYTKN